MLNDSISGIQFSAAVFFKYVWRFIHRMQEFPSSNPSAVTGLVFLVNLEHYIIVALSENVILKASFTNLGDIRKATYMSVILLWIFRVFCDFYWFQ